MKAKYLVPVLVMFLSVSCGSVDKAESERRTVTVNGDAAVRVRPDEVIITLGVETLDPILPESKSRNDKRIQAIVEAAVGMDVPPKHIKTDYFSLEPDYLSRERDGDHFIGYLSRKTVTITLRDPSKFEDLLTAALEAGATHVHGVDFQTTKLREYRDQARALAITAAKEKAELLASVLGESVGRVEEIQEGYNKWWSAYGVYWGGRRHVMFQNAVQDAGGKPASSEGPTMPGQLTIDAQVTVTFSLRE